MKRILSCAVVIAAVSMAAFAADKKLIALTFDDGPRPYVLLGTKSPQPTPGLLDLLDKNNAKATFFVMGWRLNPKTYGEGHEPNIGVTCRDGALEALKRGNEIENHTYSHVQLRLAEKQHGEAWVMNDIERGASAIQSVTNARPKYLRPPDWVMWPELQKKIESRGFQVMTIYSSKPVLLRDVNSTDYLCAGAHPVQCPKPSLDAFVMQEIAAREKHGVTSHILVFHELPSSVASLQTLIPELKARGYSFVTLEQYMKEVGGK